jgi:flagellar biosynthesis protein FlhG
MPPGARPECLTDAARLLFPPEEVAGPGFWAALDLPRLRQAFREQVRRWHPDAAPPLPGWTAAARQARFVAVKEAYDLLRAHLRQAPPLPKPRLIAVAGAKGGVGASILAANLGVFLARAGRRVILADLDPAGPILPLYLGQLPGSRAACSEIRGDRGRGRQSRWGPALLTREDLGLPEGEAGCVAWRPLLAHLQGLGAEDILCDLGAAPTAGALDLFLAAPRQLLVTTCEPAALVRAYGLLKRLRHRLPPEGRPAGPVPAPELRPLVLFNQVTRRDRPREMGRRLKEVAARCLGVTITILSLPYREEIAQSVRDLVPWTSRDTDPARGPFAALGRLFLS